MIYLLLIYFKVHWHTKIWVDRLINNIFSKQNKDQYRLWFFSFVFVINLRMLYFKLFCAFYFERLLGNRLVLKKLYLSKQIKQFVLCKNVLIITEQSFVTIHICMLNFISVRSIAIILHGFGNSEIKIDNQFLKFYTFNCADLLTLLTV